MTDIVERLRDYSRNMGGPPEDYLAWQAADEIARLRTENEKFRAALKVFGEIFKEEELRINREGPQICD